MEVEREPLPEEIARHIAHGDARTFIEWIESGQGNIDSRDGRGRTVLMLGARDATPNNAIRAKRAPH